jgi:hypothetical protein
LGKLSQITRFLAASAAAFAITAGSALAAGEIIGLDGQPVPNSLGFIEDGQAQLLLGGARAAVDPWVANGEPNTTTINQLGENLFALSGIEGTSNLSVISQSGSNNRAVQAMAGNSNALLLDQSGQNNNVLQASIGNDNLQLVGVSGQGNDVAYVQAGNELAGALNVGGSNSTVVALQTEASGRYLMPVGLGGLQDQVVIVVPGRMYVFNK